MPTHAHPSVLRALVAATLLSIAPSSAWATAPTAQDEADFKRILGIDKLLEVTLPRELEGVAIPDIDPGVRACIVERTVAGFAAHIDANLAKLITHEVANQWREFAATAPGARFSAYQRTVMLASDEAPAPDMAAFAAGLSDAELGAILAFLESPAGSVLDGLPSLTSADAKEAVKRKVRRECAAAPTAAKH